MEPQEPRVLEEENNGGDPLLRFHVTLLRLCLCETTEKVRAFQSIIAIKMA